MVLSNDSILLGLVGDDIALSRTPAMHEAEGLAHGRPTVYRRLDTASPALAGRPLAEVLGWARAMGFDGLNITHPHKRAVLELLDEIDPGAARLGSVNTVVIGRDGRLTGFNTDLTGFAHGLAEGLPGAAMGTVVQLGAGGVSHAVAQSLIGAGAGRVLIADLDPERAGELADSINGSTGREVVTGVALSGIEDAIAAADGVVNATPMGMPAHPGTPFDTRCLTGDQWIADVVYMPIDTQLLTEARGRGCRTLDGTRMAVHQAVDAFRHFTGLEPDPVRMRQTFMSLTPAASVG